MRPDTAPRADRFAAATARLLTVLAALLAVLGLAALLYHAPFPLWGWFAWVPNTIALTVLAALRMACPRTAAQPFGD